MNYEDFKKLGKEDAIKAVAGIAGVEPSVIDGLWRTESGRGVNKGPSRAGARGDFQIMPATQARLEAQLGVKLNADDFHDSAWMAAHHLKGDMEREGGDVWNALRAYNNGPRWRTQLDPRGENVAYPGKVLGLTRQQVPAGSAPLPLEATPRKVSGGWNDTFPGPRLPKPARDWADALADIAERANMVARPPVSGEPDVAMTAAQNAIAGEQRREEKAHEDLGFGGKVSAAFKLSGITGAVIQAIGRSGYTPAPGGHVVTDEALQGFTLDEQRELLEAVSPEHESAIKGQLLTNRDLQAEQFYDGALTGMAAGLAAGLAEGVLTGYAATKAVGLLGYGSGMLAVQGRGGAAAASNVLENVGGNLAAYGVESAISGRWSGDDAFAAALLGVAVSIPGGASAWHAGAKRSVELTEARVRDEVLSKQFALATQARQNLGDAATPDQLRAEVSRLEAEQLRTTIASNTSRSTRQLMPENILEPEEVKPAKPVEPKAATETTPEVSQADMAVAQAERWAEESPEHFFRRSTESRIAGARADTDGGWARIGRGATYDEIAAKPAGPVFDDSVKLAPNARLLMDTANTVIQNFLPHSRIKISVLAEGDMPAVKGVAANGVIRSAGDVHFVALNAAAGPQRMASVLAHELGHAVWHTYGGAITPAMRKQLAGAFDKFAAMVRDNNPGARLHRLRGEVIAQSKVNPGLEDLAPRLKSDSYTLNFDEFTAENFVRYLQRNAAGEVRDVVLPAGLRSILAAVWDNLQRLFALARGKGWMPDNTAFDEFFRSILRGEYEDTKLQVPEAIEVAPEEIVANFDRPLAATNAEDDFARKHGFDLMPANTPQQRAEIKAVRHLWERATAPDAPWNQKDYGAQLSKLLENTTFDPISSVMLRSENPVMRMTSYELLENPSGAAGRRDTAALAHFIHERGIMGNAVNDLQAAYAKFRATNAGHVIDDYLNGQLWQRFNREVAEEIELRRKGAGREANDAVRMGADVVEAAYDRARVRQVGAKTVGWGSLPETSKGYMPHRMNPEKVAALTPDQVRVLHDTLTRQFIEIEGWDMTFSAQLASKYIDRIKQRAMGGYTPDAHANQVGAADMVEEALTAMGMTRDEVLAQMQRFMKGGPGYTKARIDFDLLADQGGWRMLDLFETDQLQLLRQQARRVAGEVALTQYGVMGRPGLAVIRRAAQFGQGGAATARELEAFDQMAAEFLGQPFGTAAGKWADRAVQFTSLTRLGGMAFTQVAEYINGIMAVGASRVMAGVVGMPRLVKEARALARGEKVDNPILGSLEHEAAQFGTDAYKLVFPFDREAPGYAMYGADSPTAVDRLLRGGTHLQGKLSFWRAIHSAQQRGMAEQIVLKAAKYLRDGSNDTALRDMGFDDSLMARLRGQLGEFVEFHPNGQVAKLDVTKLQPDDAFAFIQNVHRGTHQIIQGTFIGEQGKWAHSGMLRLLTQFRGFSITSIEKQWGRNRNNYGAMAAVGILLGSMSLAAPIYVARVLATSQGRPDREEYLEKRLAWDQIARASMNYVASSGLLGDVLDLTSAVSGVGKQTGGRGGNETEFFGNVIAPAVGVADDLWKGMQNSRDGTDPTALMKAMPFSSLPLVQIGINNLKSAL